MLRAPVDARLWVVKLAGGSQSRNALTTRYLQPSPQRRGGAGTFVKQDAGV